MKKQVELLAPAGSVEALHAAVENGADAVYLGGKLFNARQQADNFDTEILREALAYSHARGVSLYLTLNTLVSDEEMRQALLFAAEAGAAGIDGIIVQDLGLAAALRRVVPEIPLHASTQMTIYDLDGVKALEDLGFSRVVLARELSLKEASHIAHSTGLEIEAFVHGALCVCYSGQCLMSSIIGGRSGNRGKCAQPCRLPYELLSDSGRKHGGKWNGGAAGFHGKARYLLSPKDICTLEDMDEIVSSGIRSLKIEGRMKSPEYVATVVRVYRKYLDIALDRLGNGKGPDPDAGAGKASRHGIEEADRHDLLQIFNRGGFSSGYWKGKTGADMMCFEKPNNSGIYLGSVTKYDHRTQTITVRLEDGLRVGDGIEIWAGSSDSPGGTVAFIRIGGTNVKTAGKGDSVMIGDFRGRIEPGQRIYKTTDTELNKTARESYSGRNPRRIGIRGTVGLKAGKPLFLKVDDLEGSTVSAEGTILPEPALSRPLTEERLREQIGKTGSTPFFFRELVLDLEQGLSLPVSELNEVRRNALESLQRLREDRYAGKRDWSDVEKRVEELLDCPIQASPGQNRNPAWPDSGQATGISLYFYKWDEHFDYAGMGADRVYFPLPSIWKPGFPAVRKELRNSGTEVFVWLPSITRGNYSGMIDRLPEMRPDSFDGLLAGNIGTIRRLREQERKDGREIRLAGDISMNIFNGMSVLETAGMGLESIAVSAELTLQQIQKLPKAGVPVYEAAVYGRLPLMTSEYCPAGSVEGGFDAANKCDICCSGSGYRLKDRMGAEFPLLCDRIDCRSTLLNSNVLFLPDAVGSLKSAGIGLFRLYVWDEAPERVRDLVGLYRSALDGNGKGFGKCGRLVEEIRESGFTKGHFFRGV